MKKTEKPIAVFDIDGTLFRSSLLIELQLDLVKYGIFPQIAKKELENTYFSWLDRKGSYEKFIDNVIASFKKRIKGCEVEDLQKVVNYVIESHKDRVYRYTRDLIKYLKKTHVLIAISGSPKEIVLEFNNHWKFDYVYGTVYEIDKNKKFTGNITSIPSANKKEFLKSILDKKNVSLKNSYGVGDTESDIGFLELVDNPIAFNPNDRLYKRAKKSNWKIVVERKDVIYTI